MCPECLKPRCSGETGVPALLSHDMTHFDTSVWIRKDCPSRNSHLGTGRMFLLLLHTWRSCLPSVCSVKLICCPPTPDIKRKLGRDRKDLGMGQVWPWVTDHSCGKETLVANVSLLWDRPGTGLNISSFYLWDPEKRKFNFFPYQVLSFTF